MAILSSFTDLIKGCPRNIKRRLLRDILLILFVTSGAILAIVFLQGIKTRHDISTTLIKKANRQVENQFHSFTEPLSKTITLLGKWGESGLLKLDNPKLLSTQFQALIEIQSTIHSISLADTEDNTLQLAHNDTQWLLQEHHDAESITSHWLNGEITHKNVLRDEIPPDPTPWFRGAMTLSPEKQFFLTAPHSLHPTGEEGITVSKRWAKRNAPDKNFVSAISFTLKDLITFMGQLQITPNSRILLIRQNNSLLSNIRSNTLSRYTPSVPAGERVEKPALSEQLFKTILHKLETNISHADQPISIKDQGETWWLGLSPLNNSLDEVWFAVVIPEADIFQDLQKEWLRFGLFVGSILLLGSIMAVFLVRKYSHQIKDLPQQHINKQGYQNEINALIRAGESTTLEFKSTMRTNLKTGKAGKEIEIAWLKTVAAFMNSEGGILLIGVDDAGEIIGTKADNFANEDKCRLHFKNKLNTHIGAEFTRFIHLKVVILKEQTLLIVECERVRRPVFLSMRKQEDFYIRSGPSSMKLSMSQMIKYLGER